ncbi:tetratricopeptide repeat protein [Nocardiopsis alba]|uniref:tetratricopeptide repeat protein n=1 Tax=Nocardiopsis alba TaxID=53437 RepID=UPI0033BAAB33
MPQGKETPFESSATRIPGGPGWSMDHLTLLPVIDDLTEFRRAHADDPALSVLEELWSGRPERAEPAALALVRSARTARHRALLADVRRDLGRVSQAVEEYRDLLREHEGTGREAALWQHLGKAYFVGGAYGEAADAFETALRLRLDSRADPDLVTSSRQALDRARSLAGRGSEGTAS